MKRSRSDLNEIESKSASELGLKESSCVKGLFDNNNCPRRYQLAMSLDAAVAAAATNNILMNVLSFRRLRVHLTISSQNSVMNRIINVVKGPLTSRKAKNGKLVSFVTRRAKGSVSHSHTSSSFDPAAAHPPPNF